MDWRNSKEYRVWRANVIRRDGRCIICDALQGREAHHLNHATYFVELRFIPENGVTLCKQCHSHFHNNFKQNTRQKCTSEDFFNFKSLCDYIESNTLKQFQSNNELL